MSVTQTKAELQRAIDDLGAVEVAPELYAFQPNQDDWRAWRVTSRVGLVALLQECCGPHRVGVLMPGWWSPEQRFAWRFPDGSITAEEKTAREAMDLEVELERLTADVQTGEEVPA